MNIGISPARITAPVFLIQHRIMQKIPRRGVKTTNEKAFMTTDVRLKRGKNMVPMSAEMREVLGGLARFDLIPDSRDKKEKLEVLQASRKRHFKRKSLAEKSNGRQQTALSKHLLKETTSKLDSSNKWKQSSCNSIIDYQDVGMASRESYFIPRRSRSNTTPWSHHFSEESEHRVTAKRKLQVTLNLSTPMEHVVRENVDLNHEHNRPRASTFPLLIAQEDRDVLMSPSSLETEKQFYGLTSARESSRKLKTYHKYSQEELDGILDRCDNWFAWRETAKNTTRTSKTAWKSRTGEKHL